MTRPVRLNFKYFWLAFISVFLFLNWQNAHTDEYFIRLTENGRANRQSVLQSNFTSIQSSTKIPVRKFEQVQFKPLIHQPRYEPQFDRWLTLSVRDEPADSLLQSLTAAGLIDFYEPVGVFQINPVTNDSLAAQQWYLEKIALSEAWQETKGNPEIVIGVIDTGIDYLHPDLQGSLWINQAEKNGLAGIDDDGNGFIDDSTGWDFTDAPRFSDGGDYRDPDNDPMDEYGGGHGTQIAGLIAAQSDNQRGIAGIAPGCRVMNLRAGTAAGYLEEDDVARAIIYALDNGARIINMSFGDVALSRLLKEIIAFAGQNGMIMIASAGNSGTNEIHYPAGLAEIITVGASTENDGLASFSSFGNHLDLAAPGVNMISTAIGGGYSTVNGTSFSAPLVSAVAGLIISRHPEFTAERVRNILKTTADDILYPGWDQYSGAGRLSAGCALVAAHGGILKITQPLPNSSSAQDTLWITGSSVHPDISTTLLDFGLGLNPMQWNSLRRFEHFQFFEDTLGFIPLQTISDTTLTIRLRQTLINGKSDELRTSVRIDRTPPLLSNLEIIPILHNAEAACLISFSSDDISTATLYIKKSVAGEFDFHVSHDYETTTQCILVTKTEVGEQAQFFIEAKNHSGLSSIYPQAGSYFVFEFPNQAAWTTFYESAEHIPPGYMLNKAVDLDHDGLKEIIISPYSDNKGFSAVESYEYTNSGNFTRRILTDFPAIPRDAGDVDGDGKSDLLLGYGNKSFLLEALNEHGLPQQLVWMDTTNFWAAAYADADGDGRGEIIGRLDSQYVVLENSGENSFAQIAVLFNNTSGDNQYGLPKIAQTDLDGDGKNEIIFGDYDGDIIAWRSIGDNQFSLLTSVRAKQSDATAMLCAANAMIICVTHTPDTGNYEHQFDRRYRSIEEFRYDPVSGELKAVNALNIFGYQNMKEFDSGLALDSLNGRLCLFASFYPNLYVFEYDPTTEILNSQFPISHSAFSLPHSPFHIPHSELSNSAWRLIWFRDRVESNTVIVDDLNGNGRPSLFFNYDRKIVRFVQQVGERPPTPFIFNAQAVDSIRAELNWQPVSQTAHYGIYRRNQSGEWKRLTITVMTSWTDSALTNNHFYSYAVSAIDSAFPIPESLLSEERIVKTSKPPRVLRSEALSDRRIRLFFDEEIQLNADRRFLIIISKLENKAFAAIVLNDQRQLLASFENDLEQGATDTVEVHHVFDADGVPVDRRGNRARIEYQPAATQPYLLEFELPDRSTMYLCFSEAMDRTDLLKPGNYTIEPAGAVEVVAATDSSYTKIKLNFSKETLAGGYGRPVYLKLVHLKSQRGVELKETDKIHLFGGEEQTLQNIVIYPQPAKPQHQEIIFAKIPQDVEINIYTINGALIKRLSGPTVFGGLRWNLRDDNGDKVNSGVYLYQISNGNENRYGKLVIVR